MKKVRLIAVMLMGLTVSACASVDTVTRSAPLIDETAPLSAASVAVNQVIVEVPRSLKASEANRFYPGGDIVWREDPLGDRYAQVRDIVQGAAVKGATDLEGQNTVNLHIEVTRFHALSEKARYTVGGMHEMQFKMTLLHPVTGQPLGEPRMIKANLKALGGAKAIAAERKGLTQRYRITQYLAGVIRAELSNPDGFQTANLGLIPLQEEEIAQF